MLHLVADISTFAVTTILVTIDFHLEDLNSFMALLITED